MADPTNGYVLHHHPVWRERADHILDASLEDGLPRRFEQLWTRRVDDDEFEVCCTPFFTYGIALGDVVRVRDDGSGLVDRVVRPSGRYLFRAYLDPGTAFEDVFTFIDGRGWLQEWWSSHLVAVDAEDADQAQEVANYLAGLEAQRLLTYETGD